MKWLKHWRRNKLFGDILRPEIAESAFWVENFQFAYQTAKLHKVTTLGWFFKTFIATIPEGFWVFLIGPKDWALNQITKDIFCYISDSWKWIFSQIANSCPLANGISCNYFPKTRALQIFCEFFKYFCLVGTFVLYEWKKLLGSNKLIFELHQDIFSMGRETKSTS